MTNLNASPKWVDGKAFEITLRKPGMMVIGIKILPRNISMKKALILIGVALLALFISPVRA